MKKKYKVAVDCAACAEKMADAATKVPGVLEATISFMTQKMLVVFEEGAREQEVMPAVVRACKRVEPDCEVFA